MKVKFDELADKIFNREIVTIGAASDFTGFSRQAVLQFIDENQLKIFDELEGKWYNESAEGHC